MIPWQRSSSSIVIVALVALSACHPDSAADSQVVAKVDGLEITQGELAYEMKQEASHVASGTDDSVYLERLVRRKLLLAEAQRQKIDQRPDFLLRMRRQRDLSLTDIVVNRWRAGLESIRPEDVTKYIAAHPEKFGERKLILIDRVFALLRADVSEDMMNGDTLDDFAELLKSSGATPVRSQLRLDTAVAPIDLVRQAIAQPVGQMVIGKDAKQIYATRVVEVRPEPLPQLQWPAAATAMIQAERLAPVVENYLKAERAKSKITYSPGYGPPSAAK